MDDLSAPPIWTPSMYSVVLGAYQRRCRGSVEPEITRVSVDIEDLLIRKCAPGHRIGKFFRSRLVVDPTLASGEFFIEGEMDYA